MMADPVGDTPVREIVADIVQILVLDFETECFAQTGTQIHRSHDGQAFSKRQVTKATHLLVEGARALHALFD